MSARTPTSADRNLSVVHRIQLAVDGDPQGFYPDGEDIRNLLVLLDAIDECEGGAGPRCRRRSPRLMPSCGDRSHEIPD